jgi:hypothetical protein
MYGHLRKWYDPDENVSAGIPGTVRFPERTIPVFFTPAPPVIHQAGVLPMTVAHPELWSGGELVPVRGRDDRMRQRHSPIPSTVNNPIRFMIVGTQHPSRLNAGTYHTEGSINN